MEEEFESLLGQMRSSQPLYLLARAMFLDLWEDRQRMVQEDGASLNKEIQRIDLTERWISI